MQELLEAMRHELWAAVCTQLFVDAICNENVAEDMLKGLLAHLVGFKSVDAQPATEPINNCQIRVAIKLKVVGTYLLDIWTWCQYDGLGLMRGSMAEAVLASIVVDLSASIHARPVDTLVLMGLHAGDSLIGGV